MKGMPATFLMAGCVLAGIARAQTDESLLVGSAQDATPLHLEGAALVYPVMGASERSQKPFWELSSEGRVRLDDSHELNPILGYSFFELRPGRPLGPLGSDTVDGSLAFATPITKVGDWFVGARIGAGYAGDHPFANSDAWYGLASVSAGRRFSNDDKLLLWLEYDGNRTLFPGVPIPQFAYAGSINPQTDYVIGIPESSIEFRPDPNLTLSLKYDALFSFDADAEWKLTEQFSAVLEYTSQEHAFHSSELSGSKRVFYDEQRADIGLRWRASKSLSAGLVAGYGFGRKISTGYDDRDRSTAESLSDGWFFRAEVSLEF
jgi:hypothetical protein